MDWTIMIIVSVTLLLFTFLVCYKQRFFTLFLAVDAQRQKERAKRAKAKMEPSLRTLTTNQLNELIQLSFERVERYLKEPPVYGVPEISSRMREIIDEELTAETRRRREEKLTIIFFPREHPLRDYLMLSEALIIGTWLFANDWKMQPAQDDFDFCFIEFLGAKIKAFGYQLAD